MASESPRLEVRNLSKTFAGVTVLEKASLALAPGEVHGLVGPNGSGKSTLIKLISGVYSADPDGEILLDGERIGPPIKARALHGQGLSFVHQDLGLVPDLSVRDNVRVGRHAVNPATRWIRTAQDAAAVSETLNYLRTDIDPSAKVSTLLPSERVAVAVARALQDRTPGAGVVVFDESSRAIPHEALPAFYDMIRLLTSEGTAVLFVSHDLKEVLEVADRATVLRNGRVVETGIATAGLDEAKLTSLVLGRAAELGDIMTSLPPTPRLEKVELVDVTGGRVEGVSATVHRGEVVGFTGTVDSGLSDVGPVLGGDRRGAGQVKLGGRVVDLARATVVDLLDAGIAFIPADRHDKGIALELSVEENATLPHLRSRGKPWWTGLRWQRAETEGIIARFDIRPPNPRMPVAAMSGGNQQKVLLGKWLLGTPDLLVLDDPTQAVDVGARHAILTASRRAAADGSAVIVCSAEVDDLAAICDRVLILQDGRTVRELTRPFDADAILAAIFAVDDATTPAGEAR
ncbi:sugar ABC transporter ATP-binding protein [Actinoplanes subtropicus]|uniref:sugar ABC transporter ATP-binding protein n=1 Tax=Actinoplanes subtropicus TaxID=543632 RepID=UPI000553E3E8|nr:sugar ABC transporter ATP-binding protein [Actinoplanes subtropicus]